MTISEAPQFSDIPFLSPSVDIPIPSDEPELFYEIINERERTTADVVNSKESGLYPFGEIQTGQLWTNAANNQLTQTPYRTVINFGALPNTTTKSVAHNISVTSTTAITRIYGAATNPTATDPNPRFIPLPYVDTTTEGNEITLYASNTNVYVVTAADFSAFTTAYVVLEYLKN